MRAGGSAGPPGVASRRVLCSRASPLGPEGDVRPLQAARQTSRPGAIASGSAPPTHSLPWDRTGRARPPRWPEGTAAPSRGKALRASRLRQHSGLRGGVALSASGTLEERKRLDSRGLSQKGIPSNPNEVLATRCRGGKEPGAPRRLGRRPSTRVPQGRGAASQGEVPWGSCRRGPPPPAVEQPRLPLAPRTPTQRQVRRALLLTPCAPGTLARRPFPPPAFPLRPLSRDLGDGMSRCIVG